MALQEGDEYDVGTMQNFSQCIAMTSYWRHFQLPVPIMIAFLLLITTTGEELPACQ